MFHLLLPLIVGFAPHPEPLRSSLPAAALGAGLRELLADGEIVVVPHQVSDPFHAVMFTASPRTCAHVEKTMLDVAGYPKIWPKMKSAEIIDRTGKRIRYTFDVDIMMSPKLNGMVEHTGPGRVTFLDEERGSRFAWALEPAGKKCLLTYDMYHQPGQRSDFVDLVNKMEPGVNDAGEIAGAMASARGFAQPEQAGHPPFSPVALSAWDALSGTGTVLRVVRRGAEHPLHVARRRVAVPPSTVLARIRNKEAYSAFVDFLDSVRSEKHATSWNVRYFGGRVDFRTRTEEHTRDGGVVEIVERVVSGDLSHGSWTWRVTPVDGGSAIDLIVDLDVTRGSRILAMLADQDAMLRDSTTLQVVFEYMRLVAPEAPMAVDGKGGGTMRSRGNAPPPSTP